MYGIENIPMDEISWVEVRVFEDIKSNWMSRMTAIGAVINVVLIMVIFKVDPTPFCFPIKSAKSGTKNPFPLDAPS